MKSQAAIPIILLLFLGLFVFYVIMMPPEEAEEFLNVTNKTVEEERIETQIGLVGSSKGGEVLGIREYENLLVSYPSRRTLKKHETSLFLSSNIIYSDSRSFEVSADENTKTVDLSFRIEELKGASVVVRFNDKVRGKFDSPQEVNLSFEDVNATNTIKIICRFNGWVFWETQSCSLKDLNIYVQRYTPVEERFSINLDTTDVERYGSLVQVNLSIGGNERNGDLVIKFNGEEIYRGRPEEGIYSKIKEVDIREVNTLEVEAEAGGVYEIRKLTLAFLMGQVAEKTPVMNFDASPGRSVKIRVYVKERILPPSVLNLVLESAGKTYVLNPARQGWNEVEIKGEDVRERNTIKFQSPGLLDVGKVEVVR